MRWRWYVFCEMEADQWTVGGGYVNEREADKMGILLFPGKSFLKRRYNTIQRSEAIATFKHELALQTGVGLALKPMKHI